METVENIKLDECGPGGLSIYPYLCPKKQLTWLWGRNISSRRITQHEFRALYRLLELGMEPEAAFGEWADGLFLNEIWDLEQSLQRTVGREAWNSAPNEARTIAINMAFNMGTTRFGALLWPQFYKCFRAGDWAGCAVQMQYTDATCEQLSKWYTDVDNHRDAYVGRSERLTKAMAALALNHKKRSE